MTKQYIIDSLQRREMTTIYGQRSKWIVHTTEGFMFDSWIEKWNTNWSIGMGLEIDESQVKARDYNGKTYFNVGAPKSSVPFQVYSQKPPVSTQIMPQLPPTQIPSNQDSVVRLLEEIKQMLSPILSMWMAEKNSKEQKERDERVSLEDIPF